MSKWQHIIVNGRDELFIGTNLLGRSWDVRGRPDMLKRHNTRIFIRRFRVSTTLSHIDPKGLEQKALEKIYQIPTHH